jgi:hypothetical protein
MTKSEIMRDFVLSQIGAPYVFGARGQLCTPEYRRGISASTKAAHPTIVSKCQVLNGKKATCEGCVFYGKRCYDCRGLTYCAAKEAGLRLNGAGCTSQWGDPLNWDKQDTIDKMPANLPCIVMRQNGKTMEHTAYNLGDGTTVEASVNVKRKAVSAGKWTHYGTLKGQFTEGETPMPIPDETANGMPTLRINAKGTYVTTMQNLLIAKGFTLPMFGADGDFGKETLSVLKDFQIAHGITVDGICGPSTWSELLEDGPEDTPDPEPDEPLKDTYTFTVPNLTADQAKAELDRLRTAYGACEMAVG